MLAVELSSFQLHWSLDAAAARRRGAQPRRRPPRLARLARGVRRAPRARIYAPGTVARRQRRRRRSRVAARPRAPAAGSASRSAAPRPGELGVVEDLLVDRAFPDVAGRGDRARPTLGDLPVPGAHNVANALAAAALARSYGVPAEAVRDGLRAFRARRRTATRSSPTVDGVAWVDDSKATNPHAAAASLAAYRLASSGSPAGCSRAPTSTTWCATAAPRLRAVVLLGTDRAAFVEALRATRAARSPSWRSPRLDTGAMSDVVAAARALAQPGRHRAARPRRRLHGLLPRLRASAATCSPQPSRAARDGRRRRPARRRAGRRRPRARCCSGRWRRYYLLLASTGLLLVLGLVMVFSASSVRSYATYGLVVRHRASSRRSSSALGLPLHVRRLAACRCASGGRWPTRCCWSSLGAARRSCWCPASARRSTARPAGSRCPAGFNLQPGELAKLALALWGADLLVRKQKLLGEWKHLLVPLRAGRRRCVLLLIMLAARHGHDDGLLHRRRRAAVGRRHAAALLRRAASASLVARRALLAVADAVPAARGCTSFLDPFADAAGQRLPGGAGLLRARPPAACSASASAPAGRSGPAACPTPTPTTSSRSSARSSACSARSPCSAALRDAHLRRRPHRPAHRRPVRAATPPAASPPGSAGAGDHQHGRRRRAAADHRHPAAAGLLRRLGDARRRWSRSACCCRSPGCEPGAAAALRSAPGAARPAARRGPGRPRTRRAAAHRARRAAPPAPRRAGTRAGRAGRRTGRR